MLFRTHLAFGFLAGLLLIRYLEIKNQILFIAVLLFFSVFPDIDELNSRISEKFKPLAVIIHFIFGHRGFFHSIYIPIIFSTAFFALNLKYLGVAALFGYLSHLFLDSLTLGGIRLLYPLKKKLFSFIKTGSLVENMLFLAFLAADIYLLVTFPF